MASGSFASSSSIPTITTNGGSTALTQPSLPNLSTEQRKSPSPVSPTSQAFPRNPSFSKSPKLLPPILPAHVPKVFSQDLMNTSRQSLSQPPAETSQNPAAILSSPRMSRPSDAPATTATGPMSGMKLAPIETQSSNNLRPSLTSHNTPANVLGDGNTMNLDNGTLTSPRSATSNASIDAALTATAGLGSESSPTRPRLDSISEALSQNPFAAQPQTPSTPYSPITGGGMLDRAGSVSSTGGGSRAKHECPNCHQTFTRHHNLKSHLLTHSHEKPFQCMTCSSRFRRLHDLKRHQKLHTGERPHVCSSCGRKFARGDALARHLRGEGGCAGRRTSLGGMPEEGYDPDGGDTMDGLELNQDDGLDDDMPDFEEGTPSGRRTASMPSAKSRRRSSNRVPTLGSAANSQQGFQPPQLLHRPSHHTYPPLQQQAQPFHPPPKPGNSMSSTTTPSVSSTQTTNTMASTATSSSSIMGQSLTDSPRPLSPGSSATGILESGMSMGRNRSPSFSSVHHQAVENRRRSNAGATSAPQITSGGFSLPNPALQQSHNQHPQQSPRSHGTSLPQPRPSSFSSQPQQNTSHAPVGLGNIFSSGEEGIWSYIQNMEKRIRDLEEKNSRMETTLAAMSAERHHQQQQQQQQQQQHQGHMGNNNTGPGNQPS